MMLAFLHLFKTCRLILFKKIPIHTDEVKSAKILVQIKGLLGYDICVSVASCLPVFAINALMTKSVCITRVSSICSIPQGNYSSYAH